jgi:hypothetical protein
MCSARPPLFLNWSEELRFARFEVRNERIESKEIVDFRFYAWRIELAGIT